MKNSRAPRKGIAKVIRIVGIASFLAWLLSSCAPKLPSPEALATWRNSMAQIPMPDKGCFQASYPSQEWREVPCTPTPNYPQSPRNDRQADIGGDYGDVSAWAPTGFISEATGSFDSVSGVTSETGKIGNQGPEEPNTYTLQINTNTFVNATDCAGSPNDNCQAWEQFIFENNRFGAKIYTAYFLLEYNTTCPAGAGWIQITVTDPMTGSIRRIDCWKNTSGGGTPVAAQAITNLRRLSMTAVVTASSDRLEFSDGGLILYGLTGDYVVHTATGWRMAEFNVFGDGNKARANFNSGSTIVPRTRIAYDDGGRAAPFCYEYGFTGESNNLNFGPAAPPASPPGPALLFMESSGGGVRSICAAATAVGDTHLTTFGGLLYDFQASGDFVLAQVDPDFVVQTRQVSGAPTWPNASVNNAVATRVGQNKVAICLNPERININGEDSDLADGGTISLPDGADVSRSGNVYAVSDRSGNSVRAEVNAGWINVTVGLGSWPAKVRGLLANADGNLNEIEASDGTALTAPFSFDDLYHRYADSWRVAPSESLLSACGTPEIGSGIPQKPFFAKDLDQTVYQRAHEVCLEAGVKAGPLLDACTLDVAVIGDKKAAQVFVRMPASIAIEIPGGK